MAGGGSVPDPNKAATQGIISAAQNYPFEYLINALSQTGGVGTLTGPTGQSQQYDFSGLGTADVNNAVSQQMAQAFLDIQKNLGPEYIKQRLADLKLADPQGYAAYGQLFEQIMQEANQGAPNMQLSQQTQDAVNNLLLQSQSLTPEERMQVEQAVRGNQVASGIYLGNAPAQQEASAVTQALDSKQSAAQREANSFLTSGVSPSDIQFRKIQQDLANLGAFVSGTNPTSQFSSLSGAQSTAAPYPATGYQVPTLNEGQAAQQGLQNAYDIYSANTNWANNSVNPYIAGLNLASNLGQTAVNLGYSPWASSTYPTTQGVYGVNYGGAVSPGGTVAPDAPVYSTNVP